MTNKSDALSHYAGLTEGDLTRVLDMLAGTDVLELDVTIGSAQLSLRRSPGLRPQPVVAAGDELYPDPEPPTLAITSPLVGIFRPAVQAGEQVQAGQPIGAIEALGMPTSVDAPQGGSIEHVLVDDGTPVEYGQPLLVLRRG